jgi:hypothetical protein
MELMDKELIAILPKLYQTEKISIKEKIVQARYYAVNSSWQWYMVEYDSKTKVAFGYVVGFEKEWGYFSLEEFEEINKDESSMIQIVRDDTFKPIRFGDLQIN